MKSIASLLATLSPLLASAGALSPAEEQASFNLADPDLRVELVAAEPDVTSPVAIAWDAQGRLFVAEMNDYPTASTGGRIRRLVDKDGDGKMDVSTVFADDLHFPASVLPWRDGLLVAAAPNIVFLRDIDGDGRADERRVLLSGFAEGNQQLRVNALTWGFDHWIYGANGRSDGELRGGTLSAPLSLRRRDFRFRPDTGEVESLAGASQSGLGFDTAGNRFLSWNTIPLRHEVIPQRYLDAVTGITGLEALQDCLDPTDNQRVFPLAPVPPTFNRESTSHFNALAGLHIFGGDALGTNYAGNAFMGETLRSLVHRRVLTAEGSTFVARRAASERDREFLAAADPWFHPVHFSTGPDGALYVCDFYRRWVEHPGYVPEHLRGQADWREGWEHGRIWRVTRATPAVKKPAKVRFPGDLSDRELVARLGHSNAWQRLTSQRLLVEGHPPPEVPRSLVRRLVDAADTTDPSAGPAFARLHALWTLDALRSLKPEVLIRRLADPTPSVRLSALRILEGRWSGSVSNAPDPDRDRVDLQQALQKLTGDPSAPVRLRLALVATALPARPRADLLATLLRGDVRDPWITRAALVAGAGIPEELAIALRSALRPELTPFLAQLGALLGASPNLAAAHRVLEDSAGMPDPSATPFRIALLAGLTEGLLKSGRSPTLWLAGGTNGALIQRTLRSAADSLPDTSQTVQLRVLALGLRVASAMPSELTALRRFLLPDQPAELQLAAADRLAAAAAADVRLSGELLSETPLCTSATRRRLLALTARSATAVPVLLDAFESGRLVPAELDAASRDGLLRHANPEIRARAMKLWATNPGTDRATVIGRYAGVLGRPGDRRRGAELFAKNCAVCHRIGPRGGAIGPDLSGIGSRAPEILLIDILDPSRQLTPDYLAYTVATRDGESHTGLLLAETAAEVTLRRANLPDQAFPRGTISSVRAEKASLMPDGLEAAIPPEAMPDLLSFMADPDPALLPVEP